MFDFLCAAIRQRKRIHLVYEPGLRLIEPHCFGESANGDLLLRAYQVSGASAGGEHVNWKLFRVDRITSANDAGEVFDGPRPQYNPDDRVMKRRIIARL